MNKLERIYGIGITELCADNLFYSVISRCKEKEILTSDELLYVDLTINRMLEETARFCRKGYIKQDTAVIMLKNVFMILDSLWSVSEFPLIIETVKKRELYEAWKRAIFESNRYYDRAVKNFACLEHLARKNPGLYMDFALRLKNDTDLANIFTFSLDRAVYIREFFSLGDRTDYRSLSELSEILCTEVAFLDKRGLDEIYPLLSVRGAAKREGVVTYSAELLDFIVISMCFSAFYRCDGIFPPLSLAGEILEILRVESAEELSESFLSFLRIAAARYEVDVAEYNDSIGENMVSLYATRVCEENLALLSKHLASLAVKYRNSDAGVEKIIHFI